MHRYLFLFMFFGLSSFSQHQDKVDFVHGQVHIYPLPKENRINGNVIYKLKVLENVDSVFLDAKNINFSKVLIDGKKVKYNYDGKKISVLKKFKKSKDYMMQLEYWCMPDQTVYFLGWDDNIDGNEQIWTQGQGKYTSHWLPSFDNMEEKVEFDINITFNAEYSVIANGNLLLNGLRWVTENEREWVFDMKKPMSSYLLAFAIGKYEKQLLKSYNGVSIENYFYPEDSLRVEPTYRYTKEIFDFFEEEIGIAYPWQNYKQVPVHDFLYAGMENTGATIFSDAYVIDSTAFIDRNYVNINAHEMAHQWFGNLVTEKDGNHHWLHEGFATYYAYLAEKNLFGADHFYWKLFDTAQQLEELSMSGKGESLLDPKASSLTFYEKGAWALVILREQVGEEAFRKGVRSYLQKFAFENVTVDDFLHEIEIAANKDLNDFKSKWLESTSFPWEDVKAHLISENESLNNYFYVHSQSDSSTVFGDEKMMWFWNQETTVPFKTHFLFEYFNQIQDSTIHEIFNYENSLEVRQVLAISASTVKVEMKEKFESLLSDASYVTQEHALFKLWEAFPEERVGYLNDFEEVIGLPNKNVRLLWLTLALVTPEYNASQKRAYLDELVHYTYSQYNPEVRQGAFQYLYQINGLNDIALKNLILATDHHSWQFRSYCRNLLDEILKDVNLKNQLIEVAKKLNDSDLRYLKTKIELP